MKKEQEKIEQIKQIKQNQIKMKIEKKKGNLSINIAIDSVVNIIKFSSKQKMVSLRNERIKNFNFNHILNTCLYSENKFTYVPLFESKTTKQNIFKISSSTIKFIKHLKCNKILIAGSNTIMIWDFVLRYKIFEFKLKSKISAIEDLCNIDEICKNCKLSEINNKGDRDQNVLYECNYNYDERELQYFYSNTSIKVAIASNCFIYIACLTKGYTKLRLNEHTKLVTDLKLMYDKLISCSMDKSIIIWDIRTLKPIQKVHLENIILNKNLLSIEGPIFNNFVCSTNQEVLIYNLKQKMTDIANLTPNFTPNLLNIGNIGRVNVVKILTHGEIPTCEIAVGGSRGLAICQYVTYPRFLSKDHVTMIIQLKNGLLLVYINERSIQCINYESKEIYFQTTQEDINHILEIEDVIFISCNKDSYINILKYNNDKDRLEIVEYVQINKICEEEEFNKMFGTC